MTWSDPVDATASVTAVTAAREKTYILDNLRAIAEWTSYTPTLTQSGTVTKTTTYAKYRSFGGTVEVVGLLTVTGSGTANNAITVSLPVTAATSDQGIIIGSGMILDQGTARYPAIVCLNTTTTLAFWRNDISAHTGVVGVDPNFGLANTDTVSFFVCYEAA